MADCDVCGKCPCYEHERRTVTVEPVRRLESMAELESEIARLTASIEHIGRRMRRRIAVMRVVSPLLMAWFWLSLVTSSHPGAVFPSLLALGIYVPMFAWWHSSERDAEAA